MSFTTFAFMILMLFYTFCIKNNIRDSKKIVGVAKSPNDPSMQQVDLQHPDEDGLHSRRKWNIPENIEAEILSTFSNHKVKVDGEMLEISNNIPKNKKGKNVYPVG